MNITESTRSQDGTEVRALSLGLETLDDFFVEGGVRMGSLVSVRSDPNSLGEYVIANMIAQRPAYYYTLGRSGEHIKRNISDVPNVNFQSVRVKEVKDKEPIDALYSDISTTDFPTGLTLIIDPINQLEKQECEKYKRLLRMIEKKIRDNKGVTVLHSILSDDIPQNRWVTEYMCDTSLEVTNEYVDETIKNFVAIRKAYPNQELKQANFRRFELLHDLDTDVTTTRNVSP